jgi:hypothetical protein
MVPLASISVIIPMRSFESKKFAWESLKNPGAFADSTLRCSGTTYSCVANYDGNNVEIIANEQGSFTTPSFVSFTENERLIGEAAKNQAAMNPANTVFDVK